MNKNVMIRKGVIILLITLFYVLQFIVGIFCLFAKDVFTMIIGMALIFSGSYGIKKQSKKLDILTKEADELLNKETNND